MIVAPKDRTCIHDYSCILYISTSLCKLVLVNWYWSVFFGLHHIIQVGKSWQKTGHPQNAATWSPVLRDLTWRLWQHLMPWRSGPTAGPGLPKSSKVFQSHRSVSSGSWMISGIVEQVIIGIYWNMMGKNGMFLRLCQFQEFGCCYFGDPTVRGKEYWPLLIAVFGRVLLHQFLNATGRVATDQVLLYPFCSGLQGWHMKLRTETCCWVSVIS